MTSKRSIITIADWAIHLRGNGVIGYEWDETIKQLAIKQELLRRALLNAQYEEAIIFRDSLITISEPLQKYIDNLSK